MSYGWPWFGPYGDEWFNVKLAEPRLALTYRPTDADEAVDVYWPEDPECPKGWSASMEVAQREVEDILRLARAGLPIGKRSVLNEDALILRKARDAGARHGIEQVTSRPVRADEVHPDERTAHGLKHPDGSTSFVLVSDGRGGYR